MKQRATIAAIRGRGRQWNALAGALAVPPGLFVVPVTTNIAKVTTNANKRQQTELGEMGLLHSYTESNYKHLQTPTNFVTTNLLQTPTN